MASRQPTYKLPRALSRLVGYGRVIVPGSIGLTWGVGPGEDASLFYGAVASAYEPGTRLIGSLASGKGHSVEEAATRAIAEGFERFVSGLVRVDAHASANELSQRTRQWLDPHSVAPLSSQQYERLPRLQQFTSDQPLQWVEGRFHGSNKNVLVPIDLVFWPCDTSRWNRKPIIDASPCSGAAAHTNEQCAIEHGLLELVERHALTLSWFARVPPRRIDSRCIVQPWASRVEYWEQYGRIVDILDLSAYGRGAVVVAVTIRSEKFPCLSAGAGASCESFDQALSRAFREAEICLQMETGYPFPGPIQPEQVSTSVDHACLYAFPGHAHVLDWLYRGSTGSKVPSPSKTIDELVAELDPVVVRLAPLGNRVAKVVTNVKGATLRLIDSTPLSAVRVICPDLVPMHFGYGTGYYTHPAVKIIAQQNRDFPHFFA